MKYKIIKKKMRRHDDLIMVNISPKMILAFSALNDVDEAYLIRNKSKIKERIENLSDMITLFEKEVEYMKKDMLSYDVVFEKCESEYMQYNCALTSLKKSLELKKKMFDSLSV